MDWSNTKTIFIIVFLVLDVFLLSVFLNRYSTSQFEFIKEASIEDKLKSYNVEYEELPEEVSKEPYITGEVKTFTEREIGELSGQSVRLRQNDTNLVSYLKKPVKLGENKMDDIRSFIESNVLYGDQYSYWDTSEEKDGTTYIFYQYYQDRQMFENIKAQLSIKVNRQGEIVSYHQMMLEKLMENGKEEEILSAHQAVQTLYLNGLIKPNSEISNVELGYYTVVQLTETQVLSPTWYFKIKSGDETEKMYVNAFDGSIYKNEESS